MPAITNNVELQEASVRNNIPLVGVFYKDQLPLQIKPGSYIINLSESDDGSGGTHWVGAIVEGRRVVYFDPFGIAMPKEIERYFSAFQVEQNQQQIQNIDSNICGYYVLYFLYYMTHRRKVIPNPFRRLKSFLRLWDRDDPENNREILGGLLHPLE